jgi:hypothetical protein
MNELNKLLKQVERMKAEGYEPRFYVWHSNRIKYLQTKLN